MIALLKIKDIYKIYSTEDKKIRWIPKDLIQSEYIFAGEPVVDEFEEVE